MSRRERPPGFQVIPGALLRDPAFTVLTPVQRGAYFSLLLQMWERGRVPSEALPTLSQLGADWVQHAESLRPLFEVRRGKWSIRWLNRYAVRVRRLKDSGQHGAEVTNLKRRRLRESADGTAATRSGSGSSSTSGSDESKTRASAEAEAPSAARWSKNAVDATTPRSRVSQPGAQGGPEAMSSVLERQAGEPGAPATERAAALELVTGLAVKLRLPDGVAPGAPKQPPTDAAWDWLRVNATPERAAEVMRFVAWLVKTGTRDGETVLALVKHFTIYNPRNPYAYYSRDGNARQSIAMGVAADRAIAEHERIKREEREFLGGMR